MLSLRECLDLLKDELKATSFLPNEPESLDLSGMLPINFKRFPKPLEWTEPYPIRVIRLNMAQNPIEKLEIT